MVESRVFGLAITQQATIRSHAPTLITQTSIPSVLQPGHFCQGMAPVVDGEGGFLPDTPQAIRASGEYAQIPVMNTINLDDGSLYTLFCEYTYYKILFIIYFDKFSLCALCVINKIITRHVRTVPNIPIISELIPCSP